MALTQTHAEPQLLTENLSSDNSVCTNHESQGNPNLHTVRSIRSSKSWQSIRSLREIPYVETSFDYDHDSMVEDRASSLSASYLATPKFAGRIDTSSPASLNISESPWCKSGRSHARTSIPENSFNGPEVGSEIGLINLEKELTMSHNQLSNMKTGEIDRVDKSASIKSPPPPLPDSLNFIPIRSASPQHSHSTPSHFSESKEQLADEDEQTNIMDEIAKAAGALAVMRDNITTWAPAAHSLVVIAAALQRDTAAFASTLRTLLNPSNGTINDPNLFTSQYYQLREAYSVLLNSTEFNSNCTSNVPSSSSSIPAKHRQTRKLEDNDDAAWDDRQLLDSFMTLLRTSPGFIVSAMQEMTDQEIENFCSDSDGSALNVLFYGVLGSSTKYRPLVLAEVVNSVSRLDMKIELARSILREFVALSMGSLSEGACAKAQRFIRGLFSGKLDYNNFESILDSCLTDECKVFLESTLKNSDNPDCSILTSTNEHPNTHSVNLSAADQTMTKESSILAVVSNILTDFSKQLIIYPHQFDLITDTYVGEKQREMLEVICDELQPYITAYVYKLAQRQEGTRTSSADVPLWQADELIAVKGSDIILLFNSLLPSRAHPLDDNVDFLGNTTGTFTNDEDEWCLESIRSDLVPVMQGLSHSTLIRSDGWQIFKIGEDGLMTDLGSDMGLTTNDPELTSRNMEAVCEAISQQNLKTVSERIEASRRDAQLRGDFFTLFNLQNAPSELDDSYVEFINKQVSLTKYKCNVLRRVLDNAAREQRKQRERLFQLISIMDNARVFMWYETEAKLGSPYFKSREFLQMLYPKGREEEAGISDSQIFGHAGDSASTTTSTTRSRRLSILSSHSVPESPFFLREKLSSIKLSDKEVEKVIVFMRQNGIRNVIPAEERFHRGLVEVASLARKVMDRDHLASYVTFKRDRHFQTQHSQQNSQSTTNKTLKRSSHRHRRSSLGLFDFFDSGASQQNINVTLHTTTSTQLLGLSSSHESLRHVSRSNMSNVGGSNTGYRSSSQDLLSELSSLKYSQTSSGLNIGPPKWPSIYQVQAIILSDIGHEFMVYGTETDRFMEQTGRMLLGGDGTIYQPILEEISMQSSPEAKLSTFETLFRYARYVAQQRSHARVSRADLIQELSHTLGREPGSLFRDLQVISTLVNPDVLGNSDAFLDILEAATKVLDLVVVKSMDYASRFLRYCMETNTTHQAPKTVLIGINDAVQIWAFCAKAGNRDAQQKLSEFYMTFKHIQVDLKPLTRPTSIFEGVDHNGFREAVAAHWLTIASRI